MKLVTLFLLLLVCHLRLSQRVDETVVGWLNQFLSKHFTSTSTKTNYYTQRFIYLHLTTSRTNANIGHMKTPVKEIRSFWKSLLNFCQLTCSSNVASVQVVTLWTKLIIELANTDNVQMGFYFGSCFLHFSEPQTKNLRILRTL